MDKTSAHAAGSLAGHELLARWRRRERFVVLDADFRVGHRFLAIWQAWRDDPMRCDRLVVIAIQSHHVTTAELRAVHGASASPELAEAMRLVWPPPTPDLHRLSFETGRVELLLAHGDATGWLRQLVADVDAFFVDADRHPDLQHGCKALGRLAGPGATLVAESAPDRADALRAQLASTGFFPMLCFEPGECSIDSSLLDPRRESADRRTHERASPRETIRVEFRPAFVPRRLPARLRADARSAVERHAVIVGAGLAGCAAACAFAERGWRSTLIERTPGVAGAASGNPAGLFHGIVNTPDGLHARFNRAAALAATDAVRVALTLGVAGSTNGLLRLETRLDAAAMQAQLARLSLPPTYVRALGADAASEIAGMALAHPCWFYTGGGWVEPAGLARSFLERAGTMTELRHPAEVHRLERSPVGWCVRDACGQAIAESSTVVLANAHDALRLLDAPGWPLEHVRGQISVARASRLASPHVPVTGSGYLLPAFDGAVMFGATAQRDDDDPNVRESDHVSNLQRLAGLLGRAPDLRPGELEGRTAWRCSALDRLPLIGAVPEPATQGARLDQPRFVPRLPGLYVFTGLGSRGITWCALGAQVLASCVAGGPAPVGASLLDAIDPARFVSRRMRRARTA